MYEGTECVPVPYFKKDLLKMFDGMPGMKKSYRFQSLIDDDRATVDMKEAVAKVTDNIVKVTGSIERTDKRNEIIETETRSRIEEDVQNINESIANMNLEINKFAVYQKEGMECMLSAVAEIASKIP